VKVKVRSNKLTECHAKGKIEMKIIVNYICISLSILHSSFEQIAYSQLQFNSMSSAMEIPLIFCHITTYINDTDTVKLSRINKYSYGSLSKYVNLTSRFTMKQLKKNRKFQIRKILIRSSNEFKKLLVHPSCTKIHALLFNGFMNDSIEQYPQNIREITFNWHYNQPTNNLPSSVTHVTFGDHYNQPTNNLPPSVTHVTFGWNYNQPTNNLPAAVTHIIFGFDYNQPTNNLPPSVIHVKFGVNYDQPTDHLPASVTHVIFGNKYNQPTNNLPSSVTHVMFGTRYKQPLDKLPASVKEVEIRECWNYDISTIPEHVKIVRRKQWFDDSCLYKYKILR
jgi:hypothetical protein